MITDEMVALAMRIAQGACRVGAGDGNTYVVSPPTMETTHAALAAVLPLIRNAAFEEAARHAQEHAISEGWSNVSARRLYNSILVRGGRAP